MQTLLLESAIRATLIAAVIALVLLAMRIKTASVLHAVWASVVILMLLLPAWIAWGPKASLPVLSPESGQATAAIALPIVEAPTAASVAAQSASAGQRDPINWMLGIYLTGLGVLLVRLAIGTIRANRLTSASCVVPVTVGLLHPRIILPETSREWPPAQLDAVLAHEHEHVRRRDTLFQWLALLNRALFWFHPLAWWLERRLSGLAEEACDAAVISRGYDPRAYSEYLLDLARSVRRAGTRVNAVGMAMPGSGLAHRIRQMLSGAPVPRISRSRMGCTVAVCAAAAAILAMGTLVHAQPPAATRPRFEVASIKPSLQERFITVRPLPGGRLTANAPLRVLMENAYAVQSFQIAGGPDWINSERYQIEAKAGGNPSRDQTFLALQLLLEDRFELKIHRETKELPVYALVAARSGPKLTSPKDEGCTSSSLGTESVGGRMTPPGTDPPSLAPCGGVRVMLELTGARMQGGKIAMPEFTRVLSMVLGRPVVDKTGFARLFDLQLDFLPDEITAALPPPPPGGSPLDSRSPSILIALQEQLGLRIESTKGPVDVLVIDHVEKPSEN